MRSVSQIARQFKQNWLAEIDPAAIEFTCRQHGCRWRDRVLTPVVTVQVFLLQVLHGNTACTHLSKLAKLSFTALLTAILASPLRTHEASQTVQLHSHLESCNGSRITGK